MAETPSQPPSAISVTAVVADDDTDMPSSQYWCYQCNKRVSVETLPSLPDVIICHECKNGFVELIPIASSPSSTPTPPSLTFDQPDDAFGSQFLQVLRQIVQAARDEDAPQPPAPDANTIDDFLRIEFDGWVSNEDEDENGNDEDDSPNENENENNVVENQNNDENDVNREEDEEDLRGRRRELLRLRIRDFATRARTGRNRILDWAEILMGLEDNSIEFRLEVPETDRYAGNPEDYVDAAGYEALLQNLAESDGGRRGAPPAAKSVVLALETVEIKSEDESIVCAICKDVVGVGEVETKMPCGHGYHGDCIVPWLGARNSCPVCRFELPTDDLEYEEEKRKIAGVGANGGGASGSRED